MQIGEVSQFRGNAAGPDYCAYPENNVKLVTGPNATNKGIMNGLKWLQEKIEADFTDNTTAIVFYSGHAWREDSIELSNFYLVPYDVEDSKISSSSIPAKLFDDAIAKLSPRRLLVLLDCCHAGGFGMKDMGTLPDGYLASEIPPGQLMGNGNW